MTAEPIPLIPADPQQVEAQLIERAKSDPAAYGVLYRLHYRAIAQYLFRRTGDFHAAEDLACETFMAAYRSLGRYQSRGIDFRSFLYRIATNNANRWARKQRRLRLTPLTGDLAQRANTNDAINDATSQHDTQAALLSLSPIHQTVLVLHHVEDVGLARIASILGCRLGTVKSRLARARAELARAIELRRRHHG